jgi:uncharacterized protein
MHCRLVFALIASLLLAACGQPPGAELGGAIVAPGAANDVLANDWAATNKVVLQQWEWSCGAAALATILTYQQGDKVGEEEVIVGLFKHTTPARVQRRLGFSLLDLKQYAESRGYRAEGLGNLSIDDLATLGPSIVPIRLPTGTNHFIVFRGRQGHLLLFADPAAGSRVMEVFDFEKIWIDHDAFFVAPKSGRVSPDPLAATSADFAKMASSELRPANL